jgi:hypothetical protein
MIARSICMTQLIVCMVFLLELIGWTPARDSAKPKNHGHQRQDSQSGSAFWSSQ